MVNAVLVNYFREGLAKGNSIQILKKILVDAGWPEVEVDAAKNEVRPTDIKKPLVQEINDNPLKNDFAIRKRPMGVALSAIWYLLIALFCFVSAIVLNLIFGGFSIVEFIIRLIISLLPLFIGISLWKGREDGRIIPILLGGLGIIFLIYLGIYESILDDVSLIIIIVLEIIIGIYLLSNRKAKEYFRKKI